MVQVYLPLGYPALSGEVAQMLIYQGNIVRLYQVPVDPRTEAQMVQRKLLSDVSKMRGSAGKWAKSAWKLSLGKKWSSVITQMVQGDAGGFWSAAIAEYELLDIDDKESWDLYSPYQATYNDPGLIFYALARALWLWDENESTHIFYQPNPATQNALLQFEWWTAELTDFGWQRKHIGDGFIDDRDLRWTFGGSWNEWNGAGPAKSTLMQTSSVGAWAEFSASEAWCHIGYMTNTDCGVFHVFVDGLQAAILDGYALTFTKALWVDILRPGQLRTYRIVHAGTAGQVLNLDGIFLFLFYRFLDVDLSIGTWAKVGALPEYESYVWESTNEGAASVEFNIVGSYIEIHYIENMDYGLVDVFVDGTVVLRIDQFSVVEHLDSTAVIGRFSYGLHHVKLEKVGAAQFNIGKCSVLRKMSDLG